MNDWNFCCECGIDGLPDGDSYCEECLAQYTMSDPRAMIYPSSMKGNAMSNRLDFEKAWLDVYFMMEDNAFDSSRVFYSKDGIVWCDGVKYAEVPF